MSDARRLAPVLTLALLTAAPAGAAVPADLPAKLAGTLQPFQTCLEQDDGAVALPLLVDVTIAVSPVGSVSVAVENGPKGAARTCMEQVVLQAVTPLSVAPGTQLHAQLPPGYTAGQLIEAQFAGQWSKATVVRQEPHGELRVRWDGSSAMMDSSKGTDEVRPRTGVALKQPVITEVPPAAPRAAEPVPKAPEVNCQQLSDTYGIVAGMGFGFAPADARAQWARGTCATRPTASVVPTLCAYMDNFYGIRAGVTFGMADIDVQSSWKAMGCGAGAPTAPAPVAALSCQQLSDAYAMTPQARGFAPEAARAQWRQQICRTRPAPSTVAGLCQTMADRYGILNGLSFGTADADTAGAWVALGCTAEPRGR